MKNKRRTYLNKKANLSLAGFTFVELVIAVVILVGSISGIIYSYIVFMDLAKLTQNISLASRVACAKLEDIRSDSFYDIDQYKNQIFYPQADDPYPQEIRYEDLDYRGIVYVDDISSELKQVTVVVCWRQGQRIIGEDWVFQEGVDPSAYPRPNSPVTLITLITER
jgi:type II secretory pathway pseudopilin PulG